MANPLVSVVLPTYNRAHALETSIRSVLEQTVKDLELLVVDDGSTDDSGELVAQLDDGRITYLRHPENRGANAARNTGIAQSRGTYIAFQDSDDEWLAEKLETQLPVFKRFPHRRGVVYCQYQRIEDGQPGRIFGEPFNRRTMLYRNVVGTPTIIAHSECLRVERFDERLRRRQDWELCLRLMQQFPFGFVPRILVYSHVSRTSISRTDSRLETYEYVFSKHRAMIRTSRRVLAEFYYRMGVLAIKESKPNAGRLYLGQAIRVWPLDIRFWARYVALLLRI